MRVATASDPWCPKCNAAPLHVDEERAMISWTCGTTTMALELYGHVDGSPRARALYHGFLVENNRRDPMIHPWYPTPIAYFETKQPTWD